MRRYDLKPPVTRIWQQLKVGVLPVDLYVEGDQVSRVVMTQDQPKFLAEYHDTARLAAALSMQPEDIAGPCQVVSTGLPQMMIPVRSMAAVRGSTPNVAELLDIGPLVDTCCFVVFSLETLHADSTLHVRMYAPAFGIMEDPATGSAAGGLGAYLVHYGMIPVEEPTTRITIEQGYEIDRPSTLHTEVDSRGGAISAVRVGGQVAPIIEGTVRLP